jgi:ABC-type sugar transport system substrate-binding protein
MRLIMRVWAALAVVMAGLLAGCDRSASSHDPDKPMVVGVAFDTLQTEYWVASLDALRGELDRHGAQMIEAVANNDSNRQLEQVNNFIARKVDGIIIAPKDARAVIPMIRAANRAGIPVVLYNRPPADNTGTSVTVVADNYVITKATVEYMIEQARKTGRKHKAMILIGDLGDINAIGRRDGFEDAVKAHPDIIEVVARIPTEWDQQKAMNGVTNALQTNPDISFIFTSSDFLFPSIVSALKNAGRYRKIGEEGHVILGGFDGDATAYQMLVDGYLDATGVQDVYFECEQAVKAIIDMRAGRAVDPIIRDPGFVIHQGNLKEAAPRMWGANVKKP